MRRITDVNPATRSYMRGGNSAVPVRGGAGGAGQHFTADPEVKFFIWFISAMLLAFLALLGGLMPFLGGLIVIPFTAGMAITFSRMSGKLPWAWSIAVSYCLLCFLFICLLANA